MSYLRAVMAYVCLYMELWRSMRQHEARIRADNKQNNINSMLLCYCLLHPLLIRNHVPKHPFTTQNWTNYSANNLDFNDILTTSLKRHKAAIRRPDLVKSYGLLRRRLLVISSTEHCSCQVMSCTALCTGN